MDQKITVLLVDDHVLVRRGFRRILEDEADITVVGEASNGVEAVQMACDLRPRVVLMDYAMPRMNGLLATRRILRARPEIAVLMLSMHSEEMGVREVIEAGVRGYILKRLWTWIWVRPSGKQPPVNSCLVCPCPNHAFLRTGAAPD